jgi:hypothetical protein
MFHRSAGRSALQARVRCRKPTDQSDSVCRTVTLIRGLVTSHQPGSAGLTGPGRQAC